MMMASCASSAKLSSSGGASGWARRGACAPLAPHPRRALETTRARAAPHPAPGSANEPNPVMLNSHTLWLQQGARPVLFGDSYVLFPPAADAPPPSHTGPALTDLIPWRRPPGGVSLAVVPVGERGIIPFNGDPVVLQGSGYIEAEAVDAEVLPPDAAGPRPATAAAAAAAAAATTTTALVPRSPPAAAAAGVGIVPHSSQGGGDVGGLEGEEAVYESFSNRSPRRGHKIKFTCKRCGATSIRPINIHAWREGTVFARCGRCHVTHKLIDNLRLFHEMQGPVFDTNTAPLDPATPLPPGLQLRLEELPVDGGARVGGWDGFRGSPLLKHGDDEEKGSAA